MDIIFILDIVFVLVGTAICSFGFLFVFSEFEDTPDDKKNIVILGGFSIVLFGFSFVGMLRSAIKNGLFPMNQFLLCAVFFVVSAVCLVYFKKSK